jgi:hypothetical protein
MQYNFRFVSGRTFTLTIDPSATIIDVKLLLQEQFSEVDPTTVKLVHRSTILPNTATLSSTGVTSADFIVVQHRSFCRARAAVAEPITPGAPKLSDATVQELLNMGFPLEKARAALTSTRGNLSAAVDLLLGVKNPVPAEIAATLRSTINAVTKLMTEFPEFDAALITHIFMDLNQDIDAVRKQLQQMRQG